jgi:hypothetical protein
MSKFPLLANRRVSRIAQRLLAKTWQFEALFSEELHFCLYLLKVEGAVENFKNAQRFFSYFALSSHTTFSQTQTGATVLFRTSRWRPQKVDKRMVLEYTHGLFIT